MGLRELGRVRYVKVDLSSLRGTRGGSLGPCIGTKEFSKMGAVAEWSKALLARKCKRKSKDLCLNTSLVNVQKESFQRVETFFTGQILLQSVQIWRALGLQGGRVVGHRRAPALAGRVVERGRGDALARRVVVLRRNRRRRRRRQAQVTLVL